MYEYVLVCMSMSHSMLGLSRYLLCMYRDLTYTPQYACLHGPYVTKRWRVRSSSACTWPTIVSSGARCSFVRALPNSLCKHAVRFHHVDGLLYAVAIRLVQVVKELWQCRQRWWRRLAPTLLSPLPLVHNSPSAPTRESNTLRAV